jgi:hypothetical protein
MNSLFSELLKSRKANSSTRPQSFSWRIPVSGTVRPAKSPLIEPLVSLLRRITTVDPWLDSSSPCLPLRCLLPPPNKRCGQSRLAIWIGNCPVLYRTPIETGADEGGHLPDDSASRWATTEPRVFCPAGPDSREQLTVTRIPSDIHRTVISRECLGCQNIESLRERERTHESQRSSRSSRQTSSRNRVFRTWIGAGSSRCLLR